MNRPQFSHRPSRAERRAAERNHDKALRRAGKTLEQAAAGVSRHHAEAYALMWYACACGHRERIWNSRDGVTPFVVPCPSCGATTLQHTALGADRSAPIHTPHDGQRVFVDMTRRQAEVIVGRAFARLGFDQSHPKFPETVAELLSHTTGSSPLLAIAGDVAYYAPHEVTV
ncbi:hypothetical protein SAMN05444172_2617 [Burkholderia sp. GAS332]|nr:hypothetical protein SAMN05444172_2617 [Burkholderia sp. GAS332]